MKAILNMASSSTVKEVQRLTGRIAALNTFVSKVTGKYLPLFKTLKHVFQWTDEYDAAFKTSTNT